MNTIQTNSIETLKIFAYIVNTNNKKRYDKPLLYLY